MRALPRSPQAQRQPRRADIGRARQNFAQGSHALDRLMIFDNVPIDIEGLGEIEKIIRLGHHLFERHLQRQFPGEYDRYRAQVGRWLPRVRRSEGGS
jgi:hypothetical protein